MYESRYINITCNIDIDYEHFYNSRVISSDANLSDAFNILHVSLCLRKFCINAR